MSTTSSPLAALGHPFVDGEVAPEPVVLRRNVGQGALAGELERRDPVGLVLAGRGSARADKTAASIPVDRGYSPPPHAGCRADRDQGRKRPLPRRRRPRLRRQVGHRLRPRGAVARCWASCGRRLASEPRTRSARTLEIGAGTGYFTLNLLRAGLIEEAVATRHLPGDARLSRRPAPTGSAWRSRPCAPRPSGCRFPDESFDLVFGHAVLHHLPDLDAVVRRVLARPAPRRA